MNDNTPLVDLSIADLAEMILDDRLTIDEAIAIAAHMSDRKVK